MTANVPPPTSPLTVGDQVEVLARVQGGRDTEHFAALVAQVVGESNFKPNAVNHATGAAGPFQFIKSTWLSLLHDHGAEFGVKPELINQIKLDAKGHPVVANPQALKDILDLRHDMALSSKVADKLYEINKNFLRHSLHRTPTDGEVHLAYLLGATGATHLLRAAIKTPDKPVNEVIGAAATANPGLFQDRSGKMRTIAEAISYIDARYSADKAKVAAYVKNDKPPPITHANA